MARRNKPAKAAGNATAGSSTGPGTATYSRRRNSKKAAAVPAPAGATKPTKTATKKSNNNKNAENENTKANANRVATITTAGAEPATPTSSSGQRRRRRAQTFAHKTRIGMFPGRAYVVRERKGVLERLVDERMTSVGAGASLRGSVAPSVVGGPRDVGMAAEPEGEGEGDVEMNEGAEGTPSRDKGKAKEAEPEHDAVDEDIPEPEYGTPWDKRRARQLDSVLVSSMVLGIGRQDHLPNDDLLLSLHSHAAHFFSTHGALRCPRPVWRGKLWDNRKRLEVGAELAARGNVRELQRVNAAYELERAVYEADLANPAYRRHKRADMHTAMEGSALLALGVLVEEMVAHELQLAGYRPPGIPAPVPLDERGEEGHETENGNDNDHDEDN